MRIRRFLGKDGRSVMSQVKAELGAGAVILSNKTVDGQVELVAATEWDYAAFAASEAPAVSEAPAARESRGPSLSSDIARSLRGDTARADSQPGTETFGSRPEEKYTPAPRQASSAASSSKTETYNRLARLGLSRGLNRVITDKLPPGASVAECWAEAQAMIAGRLPVMKTDSMIRDGGIIALMGSTGVGKTTTIAKLAARFLLRHGSKQVALITTDCYRIGGQEQLQSFANYLGIDMLVATGGDQLKDAIRKLSPRRLILIDTAGMSQRDLRLYEQFSELNSVGHDISTYVVLSAAAQHRAVHEMVNSFGKNTLAGAIITKIDESVGLGGVLDVAIRNRLPIAYVSEGQNVPKDIAPARADALVEKAVELMMQSASNASQKVTNTQRAG